MEWWPSAGGGAWEWAWRAYPGVWAFVAAIGLGRALLERGALRRARQRGEPPPEAWRRLAFAGGLALLWAALDWPLGPLAAGYLATANAAQDLIVTLGAAPLLLLGLPPSRERADAGGRARRGAAGRRLARRVFAQPLFAAGAFGLVLAVTHLPAVVDALRPSPWGSFAIAAAWLLSAVALWSPLAGPLAGRRRLPYLGAMLFLAAPFVFPKVAGAFFVFAEAPLYEVYADAPRAFANVSATQDQHAAGFVLWVIGSLMVIAALGALFRRWHGEARRIEAPDSLEIPADPRAVDLLFGAPGGWAALEQLVASVRAALPPGRTGAALAFAFREREAGEAGPGAAEDGTDGEDGAQVILELRAALPAAEEAEVARRIEAGWAAYLGRLPRRRREAIARALAFRVAAYGSRVT